MKCRGHETRVEIVRNYRVIPRMHARLYNGQTLRSDAEREITDEYYIFECISRANPANTDSIQCGMGAARDFLEITGEAPLRIFNPFTEPAAGGGGRGGRGSAAPEWHPAATQLFNGISLLITAWNIRTPGSPLFKILEKLRKEPATPPAPGNIKALNTIVGSDKKRRTLTEIQNELRATNPTMRVFQFDLIGEIYHGQYGDYPEYIYVP